MNLRPLLAPTSVAVVGATERQQHGSVALQNLLTHRFNGAVYPVNPRYDQVFGRTCYPDLRHLPSVPECVILAIPSRFIIDALREAGRLGVRAAVIFSAGFAESGAEGRRLQDELTRVAREQSIAICGPNCMGLANLVAPAPLYAGAIDPEIPKGNVGIVAQSGSVSLMLLLAERLACSYVISSGNQAVVDSTDYLGYLVDDPHTDVIGLFIEAIAQPKPFLRLIARAHALRKPVVVCKPGRSPEAAAATLAHTGTLAGSYDVYTSICRQYGVIRVDDLDAMIEVLALLSGGRRIPERPGIGMINCSGGENALALDVGESLGLDFPALTEPTVASLRAHLPDFAAIGNPLDVTGALVFNNASYTKCLRALADDEDVGVMVTMQDVLGVKSTAEHAALFRAMAKSTVEVAQGIAKPVAFLTNVSGDVDRGIRSLLRQGNVPLLEGMHKGLQAIAQYVGWAEFNRREETTGRLRARLEALEGSKGLPVGLPDALSDSQGGPIGEAAAKVVLARYGLPVTREVLATDAPAAVAAADCLGYPVVLKINSPDIVHKTDVGGVRIGLKSARAVEAAYQEMLDVVHRRAPTIRIAGVLVQEMVTGGVEVVLGMKRDDGFGPMLLFGLGGIFVEVLRSFTLRHAPVDRTEAAGMIREIPGFAVLEGVRGTVPSDLPALADALARFSEFCVDVAPAIREIDLNPVLVLPEGQGVKIVDALFVPLTPSANAR